MEKTYLEGPLFKKSKILCIAVVEIIVVFFFFIYLYIFGTRIENFNPNIIIGIFIFIAALFWFIVDRIAEKIRKTIRYVVTDTCLLVGEEGKELRFAWNEFSEVKLEEFNNRNALPVTFVVKNKDYKVGKPVTKELDINHTVQDIYGLTQDIISHLDETVKIDEELLARIKASNMIKRM